MNSRFDFKLLKTPFDENYTPSEQTRITTNFANLARGENRQGNLRNVLRMINNRFNSLAVWDNPTGQRYAVKLSVVSVHVSIAGYSDGFPLIEMLESTVVDNENGKILDGIVGNNFSSYLRDYDFSILLPSLQKQNKALPDDFGVLHGNVYKEFVRSDIYQANFKKRPVICLSISSTKTYQRTGLNHPVLGYEYVQSESSLTDAYFAKMGLKVRFFMPFGSVAPLAFYFEGDLLNDYSTIELISLVSTMETFQKIYRPEIYNANSPAGLICRPSLNNDDISLARIFYDREERKHLGVQQGEYVKNQILNKLFSEGRV